MFRLIRQVQIDPNDIPNEKLRHLHAHWRELCAGRAMPVRSDFDPVAVADNLGRMHVLAVEGPLTFRYQIYGSGVTNPDRADMRGRTTMDYKDRAFAELVTSHLSEVVNRRTPGCYRIEGELNGKPYEYVRLALPLGDGSGAVGHVLVGTQRIIVPRDLATRPIMS